MTKALLTIIIFLMISINCYGKECLNPKFIFSFEDTQKIAICQEKLMMCENISIEKDGLISDLTEQNGLLAKNNGLLKDNLQTSEQIIINYQKIVESQKQIQGIKDQQCQEEIKKAKPGFFQKLGWFGTGTLTGAVLVIMGLLAI